jgi:hypothetical protein
MLLSSRSFVEYLAMFDLSAEALRGRRTLDVAAGASDFTAVAAGVGAQPVAVDAAYGADRDDLIARVDTDLGNGLNIIDAHADRFTWTWYGSRARRDKLRRSSRERFGQDLSEHPERYLAGSLPHLPLADQAADLVLCSHLLFTWSDQLDRQWHHDAIVELARVGQEVRIFPLVVQGTGDAVGWLPDLLDQLGREGLASRRQQVPYEFQVGADEMLVVRPRRG